MAKLGSRNGTHPRIWVCSQLAADSSVLHRRNRQKNHGFVRNIRTTYEMSQPGHKKRYVASFIRAVGLVARSLSYPKANYSLFDSWIPWNCVEVALTASLTVATSGLVCMEGWHAQGNTRTRYVVTSSHT